MAKFEKTRKNRQICTSEPRRDFFHEAVEVREAKEISLTSRVWISPCIVWCIGLIFVMRLIRLRRLCQVSQSYIYWRSFSFGHSLGCNVSSCPLLLRSTAAHGDPDSGAPRQPCVLQLWRTQPIWYKLAASKLAEKFSHTCHDTHSGRKHESLLNIRPVSASRSHPRLLCVLSSSLLKCTGLVGIGLHILMTAPCSLKEITCGHTVFFVFTFSCAMAAREVSIALVQAILGMPKHRHTSGHGPYPILNREKKRLQFRLILSSLHFQKTVGCDCF